MIGTEAELDSDFYEPYVNDYLEDIDDYLDEPIDSNDFTAKTASNVYRRLIFSYIEQTEYNSMITSVKHYGGFYIARYEASIRKVGDVKIAQSIIGDTWDDDIWSNASFEPFINPGGSSGALYLAKNVYPERYADEGDAISTMPYGVQWDATVRFILSNDSNKDVITNPEKYNYVEDIVLNNIYGMANGVEEWTMEVGTRGPGLVGRVVRGKPKSVNMTQRDARMQTTSIYDLSIGFRLALYIKVV